MKILRSLLDRFDEKTTWLALGAMLSALGLSLEPGTWEAISTGGILIAGFLLSIIPTKNLEAKIASAFRREQQ